MKPGLWIALLASLGLSAWLALQPDEAEDVASLVPATRPAAPAAGAAADRTAGTTAGTTVGSSAGSTPSSRPATAISAASMASPATLALPARAADWPAASAAALLAWGAPRAVMPAPRPAVAAGPAAAPDRPRAPPFPYQWIGTLDDGRGAQALLGGPLRGASVRAGQVLDGQWRVERVGERQLDLLWLPGEQGVTVRSGALAGGAARPARVNPDTEAPQADPEPAS